MNEIDKLVKDLNDRYFTTIKKIIRKNAHHLIDCTISTPKQDMELGFDAQINVNSPTIAIRIRKYFYLQKYSDITFRSKVASGNDTELDKIRKGCGDYYFYCWLTEDEKCIHSYCIFDIKKFVSSGLIDNPTKQYIPNADGTAFHSYSINDMMKLGIIKVMENIHD